MVSLAGFFKPVSDVVSRREQATDISSPREIMRKQKLVPLQERIIEKSGLTAGRDLVITFDGL
jgi:hypothetical protein